MLLHHKACMVLIFFSLLSGCANRAESFSQHSSSTKSSSLQDNALADNTNKTSINSESSSVPIEKVIKVGGWKIPDTATLSLQAPRTKRSVRINDKTIEIYESAYKPNQEVVVKVDRNFLLDAKTIQINTEAWGILSVKKFEIGERPFCYIMRASLVHVDENNKIASVLGTAVNLSYYDEDGDGLMELFEYAAVYPEIPNKIPQWINSMGK